MAKKSRRAAARQKARARVAALETSPATLVDDARRKLLDGQPRVAIESLKRARLRDPKSDGIERLLFCAYSSRARELALKGMTSEADQVRQAALRERKAFNAANWDDLREFASAMDLGDLVDLATRQSVPDLTALIADRAMTDDGFDTLTALPDDHPVRCDAVPAAHAREAMEDGDWTRAEKLMASISRRSPFARWRVFVSAIAALERRDIDAARRALSLLGDDFALPRAVERLTRLLDEPAIAEARNPAARLAATRSQASELARELCAAVEANRIRDVQTLIPRLAREIPTDATLAVTDTILQLVLLELSRYDRALDVDRLARAVIPRRLADRARLKVDMLVIPLEHDDFIFGQYEQYLDQVDDEFSRPTERAIARGQVFLRMATGAAHGGVHGGCLEEDELREAQALLPTSSADPKQLIADLARASIYHDPTDRDAHMLLFGQLEAADASRAAIEAALTEMARQFPDDPEPWLRLARAHHEARAHRKAEAAIEQAFRRAPHDERLHDLRTVGHLVSCDRNRARGKLALARKDYLGAEAVAPKRLQSLLQVKRMALALVGRVAQDDEPLERELDNLTPAAQLRALLMLLVELDPNRERAACARVQRLLTSRLALVDDLSPIESADLVEPIPTPQDSLFRSRHIVAVDSTLLQRLLPRLDGEPLLRVFDHLLDASELAVLEAELRRRLGRGRKRREAEPTLALYEASVRWLLTGDVRLLRRVMSRSDGQPPRAVATRIAKLVEVPLSDALRDNDPDLIDQYHAFHSSRHAYEEDDFEFGDPDPEGPAGFEQLLAPMFDDPDSEAPPVFEELLASMEALVDEMGFRGAPTRMVRELGHTLRNDPSAPDLTYFRLVAMVRKSMLSRELRALLFPDERTSNRRRKR